MLTEIKHTQFIKMNVNYVDVQKLQQQRNLINNAKNKMNKTLLTLASKQKIYK